MAGDATLDEAPRMNVVRKRLLAFWHHESCLGLLDSLKLTHQIAFLLSKCLIYLIGHLGSIVLINGRSLIYEHLRACGRVGSLHHVDRPLTDEVLALHGWIWDKIGWGGHVGSHRL